jgi:hypothetical protein
MRRWPIGYENMQQFQHPEIERLLSNLFQPNEIETINKLHEQYRKLFVGYEIRTNKDQAVDELGKAFSPLERTIGGIGYDRLFYGANGQRYSGYYPIEERDIYRPLQYSLMNLIGGWNRREAVRESCAHIESIMKRRYEHRIENILKKPLGTIVGLADQKGILPNDLLINLTLISEMNNIAKHDYDIDSVKFEDRDELRFEIDSKVFTSFEALAMYFICRKVGMDLLGRNDMK